MGVQTLSPATIRKLVESHRQFLAFVERRVESRAVAEDILQSAFARGLEKGPALKDEESVVAWFYRMLRNAVIDHYRRREAGERAVESWGRDLARQQSPDPDTRNAVCECVTGLLDLLKPEYREALEIVDVHDGSLADLATRQGITAGNAAVRIHRARAALRKQVEAACGTCAEHGCVDCRCQASGGGCSK
jgi:RNA polymerase sigma-70 factor (ECF subfamily)